MDNKFVSEFITRLDGKISDDDLKIVDKELTMYIDKWDITEKVTALVLVDEAIPMEYKMFLVSAKIENKAKGTIENYNRILVPMFLSIARPLKEYTTPIIMSYLYHYGDTVHGNHSVKPCSRYMDKIRIVINTFFNYCVDNDFLLKNPCRPIKPFRYIKKPVDTVNNIELEEVRRACRFERDRVLVDVLYSTACRISETLNIKIEDIKFNQTDVNGMTPVTIIGKGNKVRTVYLDARATVGVKQYLSHREYGSEYLFCSERNPHNQLTAKGARDVLHDIGKKIGVPKLHPHELRHSRATNLVRSGVPIQTVSNYLGHESINTTNMFYVNHSSDEVRIDIGRR